MAIVVMLNNDMIKGFADTAIVHLVIALSDYNRGNSAQAEEGIAEAIVVLNHIARRENFDSVELDNIFKNCQNMVLDKL
jgi:hypothetical protein